jgi:hypothetical protein
MSFEILNHKEVVEIFKLNSRTLSYLVATGQIPFSRLGKRMVRFSREALEAWFKKREGVTYQRPNHGK